MLSDEEKKAIKIMKEVKAKNVHTFVDELSILLNLIEKQSKEIEHQIEKRANQRNELAILNAKQIEFNKLVNTVNSYKGQFKRQEKEIEELKEIYQTGYVNGCVSKVYEINKKWKDKIKAKIEDLKENSNGDDFNLTNVIMILQSLLEKE